VRDRLRDRALPADLDARRLAQRPARERGDLRRHRRREKQSLPRLRRLLHDAFHVGQKSHVEHPVDFVEHEDVDVLERHVALLHVVEQPPRRRREDVHAVLQIFQLLSVADAGVNDRHAQVGEFGEFLERLLHLQAPAHASARG